MAGRSHAAVHKSGMWFQRATRAAATAVAEVINAAGLPKEQPH